MPSPRERRFIATWLLFREITGTRPAQRQSLSRLSAARNQRTYEVLRGPVRNSRLTGRIPGCGRPSLSVAAAPLPHSKTRAGWQSFVGGEPVSYRYKLRLFVGGANPKRRLSPISEIKIAPVHFPVDVRANGP